jgi:hypothetical protein
MSRLRAGHLTRIKAKPFTAIRRVGEVTGCNRNRRLSSRMFLSIATTHTPATDLSVLLPKDPERVNDIELTFGKAWVFYPEAAEGRCEATLLLDVNPIDLVRSKGRANGGRHRQPGDVKL